MDMKLTRNGGTLTISLSGRLDASTASAVEEALRDGLEGVDKLIFDLEELNYVSSAGLRQFIAAKKKLSDVTLAGVNRDVYDILDMTGLSEVLTIQRALRRVSIEGLTPIASGSCGDCYKIDDETILKLYREGTNPEWVTMEKEYAKAAFLMGIPTALSYDVVSCEGRRGVLFELLNARSLADTMAKDTEHIDDYAAMFAELGKTVHGIQGDPKKLPDRMEYYEKLLGEEDWLTPDEREKLTTLMRSLPRASTCLHGDFHAGNVMVQGKELLFIDMGDFSIGHPYFDLSLVYNMYTREYKSGLGLQITKLEREDRLRFFESFMRAYFGDITKKEYDDIILMLRRFACVRQLAYIPAFADTREENIAFMREILSEQSPVA